MLLPNNKINRAVRAVEEEGAYLRHGPLPSVRGAP